MRGTALAIAAALLVAAPAAAEDTAEAAHAAVREALLERATMPVEYRTATQALTPQVAHEHVERATREEAAAHSRAAAHGERHSRDTHPVNGPATGTSGGGHGSATEGGMDSSWDCHDPAEHERTRDEHQDGMPPDHGPHR